MNANAGDQLERLRRVLRDMPVPEPRTGFTDRALERAARAAAEPAQRRRAWRGPAVWLSAGAAAAAVAVFLMVPRQIVSERAAGVAMIVNEAREVAVVIDSERDLADATIRVYVTGGVEIEGFPGRDQISWTASIDHGPNVLSLPLVATTPGRARLIAVVEHGGRMKRATVELRVAPAPRTGPIPSQADAAGGTA